jgi:ABC-type transport system involved in multi-copper enzyme maturation permease subunit
MLIEISRFRRKFLSMGGNSAYSGAILGLVALCYASLVVIVLTFRADIHPMALVAVQGVLFCLLAPMLLHSSIAGERERRSWDLLLAAPITKAQIVVGKFIGALSALGIGSAAFVFPIGVTAFSYPKVHLWDLALSELVVLSFSVLVCSITLFFSARVKRSFMALGATLGTLAVGIVIIPTMLGVLTSGTMGPFYEDTILYLHPAVTLSRIFMASQSYGGVHTVEASLFGIPQVVIYLAMSAVILAWSINTLNFAENEVKFIPKAKS